MHDRETCDMCHRERPVTPAECGVSLCAECIHRHAALHDGARQRLVIAAAQRVDWFSNGKPCDEGCIEHAADCDGFCDHDSHHINACLLTPVARAYAATDELADNRIPDELDWRAYQDPVIAAAQRDLDVLRAYAAQRGM